MGVTNFKRNLFCSSSDGNEETARINFLEELRNSHNIGVESNTTMVPEDGSSMNNSVVSGEASSEGMMISSPEQLLKQALPFSYSSPAKTNTPYTSSASHLNRNITDSLKSDTLNFSTWRQQMRVRERSSSMEVYKSPSFNRYSKKLRDKSPSPPLKYFHRSPNSKLLNRKFAKVKSSQVYQVLSPIADEDMFDEEYQPNSAKSDGTTTPFRKLSPSVETPETVKVNFNDISQAPIYARSSQAHRRLRNLLSNSITKKLQISNNSKVKKFNKQLSLSSKLYKGCEALEEYRKLQKLIENLSMSNSTTTNQLSNSIYL